jgi:hypothetical protein
MADAADPLVLDFVEWIAREPRLYSEVIATWRTSCPRLSVWEDALVAGLIQVNHGKPMQQAEVVLTPRGRAILGISNS